MAVAEAQLRSPPLFPVSHQHGKECGRRDHTPGKHHIVVVVFTPTHTKDIPLISPKKCGFPIKAILCIEILPVIGTAHEHNLTRFQAERSGGKPRLASVCTTKPTPMSPDGHFYHVA